MTAAPRRAARPRRLGPLRVLVTTLLAAGLLLSGAALHPLAADAAPEPAPVAAAADPAAAATPSPAPSTTDDDAADALPVQVAITQVSPQVLRPGDDLVVRATIRNTSDGEIADPRVAVRISRFLLSTRSELSAWSDAEPTDPAGTPVQQLTLEGTLAAGAETEVELTVPAAALRLSSAQTSWGPRGISVEVTDAGSRRGLERTFALWYPADEVTTTRLSVALPFTGDAVDPDSSTDATPASPAAVARVDDMLDVTEAFPQAGWVVDPALLAGLATQAATTDAADSTDSADSTSSPNAGAVFRANRLTGTAAGRDVFALGWLDPDLGALAHAASPTLAQTAAGLSNAAALPLLGTPPRTDLAWPANPIPDQATVDLAAATGARAVVVADGLAAVDLTYTPTGRATVATPTGGVAALITDPALTAMLTDPAESTPATAAQRMLSETAVVAHERPSDPRHLFLAPARGWEPDVATASAQLAALAAAPWITPTPVSTLIGTADPGVERAALPAAAPAQPELPAGSVRSLTSARDTLGVFSAIVADPAALTADADERVLAPASVAWRADAAGRAGVVRSVVADLTGVTGSVSVVPGSSLNVISQSGTLPIGLRNDLDQDVTVQVSLAAENRLLVADAAETMLVPANSEVQARVPFQAVGSGDARVAVTLLAPDGTAISAPERFTVRIRADWENIGTGVVAGVLALAFVFGIVRTIRRGQTTRRGASQAEIARIADPREFP
ncbi:DUF6049 family protein [Pengzhenrongella sicca]|uniref:Glycoprotein n=1 Tax=Pengzhenrongella sicca TaxID=2819238 RepID=A0A8A4ZIS2_9MICO|nr:DUF6049 family protein [Pengzhenrongella sicca]QTE29498.1 hypothetical protein J4E96_19955 [Pengzhenrongella sicca]